MSREISFRGKRLVNNEWVYGDLIQLSSSENFWYILPKGISGELYEKEPYPFRENDVMCEVAFARVVPETVGQFTGLTDENGNKIFEGDIVKQRCGNTQYTVKFSDGRFIVDDTELYEYECKVNSTQEAIRRFNIVIIGNQWDNPELLEEREE